MAELSDANAEALVFSACLMYPDLVDQLIRKVGKQQMQNEQRKAGWTGFQTKSWQQILIHSLFSEVDKSLLDYEWVTKSDDSDKFDSVRAKVYSIFLERSSILFASDATLLWLKQTIGYLLNNIERIDQLEFSGKI
jgi:hypothetical protein